jgi:hypothetical protein
MAVQRMHLNQYRVMHSIPATDSAGATYRMEVNLLVLSPPAVSSVVPF